MHTFYLYILKSRSSGGYYIGSTADLPLRVRQHNGQVANLGRFTVAGRPWELVFFAAFASRAQAMAAERYVKKMKSRVWIEKLLAGVYHLPTF